MGGGGGGKQSAPLPPIPSSPTRWLHNRLGDPVELQEYGHYERTGDGSRFTLVNNNNNPAPGSGRYLSPQAAERANPRVWLYNDQGKAVKQIFMGGEGPDEEYDTEKYNLGPDAVPYRHWYDVYGVSQKYAPSSTPIPEGFYEAPSKAVSSPTYQAPVPYNEAYPNNNIQPSGNTVNTDLAATKAQAKKRKIANTKSLTLFDDSASDDEGKNLLGE